MSFFSEEEAKRSRFQNRTLFFEWGRGFLIKYRNFAALKGNFKLVGNTGYQSKVEDFELFNVKNDPKEKNNVLKENIEIATALKNEMDAWYDEIVSEKNNKKIYPAFIGTSNENPVILNRNDAKGTPVAWTQDNVLNYWEVKAPEDGVYDISCHFIEPINEEGKAYLQMYPYHLVTENNDTISELTFKNVKIAKGDYRIEPYYQTRKGKYIFPFYISVKRMDKYY